MIVSIYTKISIFTDLSAGGILSGQYTKNGLEVRKLIISNVGQIESFNIPI